MRAVTRGWRGGAPQYSEQVTVPAPRRGQILVKVRAAAINPVDYKLPRYAHWLGKPTASTEIYLNRLMGGLVAGFDFSGVVEEIGSGVEQFSVGQAVYGTCKGSLAEFAVAEVDNVAGVPSEVGWEQAAALPVAYLTSLQSLRDYGKLAAGARLLVLGASGGCGLAALQLARHTGAATIVAVCSGRNAEVVREHGATEVVDYTEQDILARYQDGDGNVKEEDKFDVVYDAATASGAGEDYRGRALKLLRPAGQYVAINGSPGMWLRTFTIGHSQGQHLVLMKSNTADLQLLAGLLGKGEIKPVLAKTLPFTKEAVQEGFELLQSRRTVGKITFTISTE